MAKRFCDIVTECRNSNVTSKYFFTPLRSSDTSASYRENDIEQRIRGLDWKVSVLESVQCIYWRSIPVPFRIQTEAIENDLGRCMLCIFFQSVGAFIGLFLCAVDVSKAHLFLQKCVMNFFFKHTCFFLHTYTQPFGLLVRKECWFQRSKIQLHFRMVMVVMIVQEGVLHIVLSFFSQRRHSISKAVKRYPNSLYTSPAVNYFMKQNFRFGQKSPKTAIMSCEAARCLLITSS